MMERKHGLMKDFKTISRGGLNQRRNEKLHPDGQYTDHLSMGGAF
jgi:hypothetical protein